MSICIQTPRQIVGAFGVGRRGGVCYSTHFHSELIFSNSIFFRSRMPSPFAPTLLRTLHILLIMLHIIIPFSQPPFAVFAHTAQLRYCAMHMDHLTNYNGIDLTVNCLCSWDTPQRTRDTFVRWLETNHCSQPENCEAVRSLWLSNSCPLWLKELGGN